MILLWIYDINCEFFKFTTLESISQYGNTSRTMHLHDICHGSAGKERNISH